jgi:hypothetical protein
MEKSKSMAAIVGPSLIAIVLSELKVWNPSLYNTQIVPLVYLSGVLLFVAGISIVRSHNIWVPGWQVILTIVGWSGIVLGLIRMFFPQLYKAQFKNDRSTLVVELLLILLGVILTIKAYFPLKNFKI